jgi:probable HAF family extracellular repeat protein
VFHRALVFGGALVVSVLGLSSAARAAYYITDLGSLGGPSSSMGINNSGQIVGYSYITSDTSGEYRAFLYDGGTTTDLLGAASYSVAYAINDSGKIVGSVDGGTAFFTYDHGTVDARYFGGDYCEGFGINNSGVIAGYAYLANDTNCYGFVYYGPGNATALSFTGANVGSFTCAYAINDSGWVVGSYSATADGADHAFYYDGTAKHALSSTLGGSVADAYAINAHNLVVGSSTLAGDAATHAYVLDLNATAGTMTDLGTLGGTISEAWNINGAGKVVGQSKTAAGTNHAFVYSNGAMTDLNSQIAVSAGWTLTSANAINDSDWIVGDGTNASGQSHAFLLKPALPGDADLDGTVNGVDLNAILSNYNKSGMDWSHGDFNGDGVVNGADYDVVLSNYNQTASASVAVPEPATLLLLPAGAACLCVILRRKRMA